MDGEEGEYDDSGEGPDLKSDPLLPGGDATEPVDLRLQQAHIALQRGQDDQLQGWQKGYLTSSGR